MTVLDDAILKVVASLIWTDGEINQNVFAAQISGGGGPYADLDRHRGGLPVCRLEPEYKWRVSCRPQLNC